MKKLITICAVVMMVMVVGAVNAATWNFENAADYWTNNAVVGVGSAYVAPRTAIETPDDVTYGTDYAAVFARVDTQAHHLSVGNIIGGGFTLSGMNNPGAVYGSLYLSPNGLGGSTVMINMSPMGRTGADGAYVYTFDLNTAADVKIKNGLDGSWGTALTTGTFGGAIDYIENSIYSGTYAAFFGPQIGMSGTSGTTFTVSQIQLVPEPATICMLGLGALSLIRRKHKA